MSFFPEARLLYFGRGFQSLRLLKCNSGYSKVHLRGQSKSSVSKAISRTLDGLVLKVTSVHI